jgi:hypothetical protein
MKKIFSLEFWFYLLATLNLLYGLGIFTAPIFDAVPYGFLGVYLICLLVKRANGTDQIIESTNARFRFGVLALTCILWIIVNTVSLAVAGGLLLLLSFLLLLGKPKPPYPIG